MTLFWPLVRNTNSAPSAAPMKTRNTARQTPHATQQNKHMNADIAPVDYNADAGAAFHDATAVASAIVPAAVADATAGACD